MVTMMTDRQFCALFCDALQTDSRSAFSSDLALSSIWSDDAEDPAELAVLCGLVWDLAHLTVGEIRSHTGLTQAQFAERFCIPLRTVQNWEYRGGCPDYVRLMLARLCGLADGIL